MSEQWYYVRSGERIGPISVGDLRGMVVRGELTDQDHVYTTGLPGWTLLGEVRERLMLSERDALPAPVHESDGGVFETERPGESLGFSETGLDPINLDSDIGSLVTIDPGHSHDFSGMDIKAINLDSDVGAVLAGNPESAPDFAAMGLKPINLDSDVGALLANEPEHAPSLAPIDLGIERPKKVVENLPPRSYPMALGDRVVRALFVAVAVGLAWGIRGDFGHLLGAMYPGAILMLALAYVSGQESALRALPALAMACALGIGLGGNMSYGLLHGYAQADTFKNYSYGFIALFLEGGAWGVFGGAFIGLLLERERANWIDWVGGVVVMAVCGGFTFWLVYVAIGFDINPPRSNDALAHVGGGIGLLAWFAIRKRPIALRAAMLGFVGFGLGMAGGRLIGNIFHNREASFEINHWNTMEVSCGMIGGFVVAFGMLGMRFRDRSSDKSLTFGDIAGAVFVLGIIPLMHRLTRIDGGDLSGWKTNLEEWGSTWTAGGVSMALNVVVLLGFAGVGVWLYLQAKEKERWGALPVLWMSLVMLLFQNFRALYFFAPAKAGYVNMHGVFWLLFITMAIYVGVREYMGGHTDECDDDAVTDKTPWLPWSGVAISGLALIIFFAGFVNGPVTMKNACTRWPIWEWNQKVAADVVAVEEN